ncbi:MAG: folylpolyglutamate synthase/dihydrofolate synthase family protein [Clostridia bacterium]|nr:folylpolyglutamate synthase/dihydrofolate synthase family protein [Clostridia bacterium]
MNYTEAISYIHGMSGRGSKLGLTRITELLRRIGDPHKQLRFVHVAGTNGKGSTAAMLSFILTAAGYKVGLYISPFIDRFNERIQLNNVPISDDELAEITGYVHDYAEAMTPDLPTEFEVITAVGFEFFARSKCDIVVLEVGLGGEFDSTNVISTPEVAVITPVDFDHTRTLGNSIEEIAHAKAGIIKPHGEVVAHGESAAVLRVLSDRCSQVGATLHTVDYSLLLEEAYSLHGQQFSYGRYAHIKTTLLGAYQPRNAAIVITAVEVLRERGFAISDTALYQGFECVRWPGRFELLCEDPVFIVDGGHNPHGIRGTCDSIRRYFGDEKLSVILGVMADKDVDGMLDALVPHANVVYAVEPDNYRSMSCAEIVQRVCLRGCDAVACSTVEDGVSRALTAATAGSRLIAVGSLYMAGEVRRYFQEKRLLEV